MTSDITSLERSIDGIEERIAGSRVQLASVQRQMVLMAEELVGKEDLLQRGYIRKPEVLALRRNRANLEGESGRLQGEIGDARERIAKTREQIAGVRKSAIKTAVEQLYEISGELNDVRERIRTNRASSVEFGSRLQFVDLLLKSLSYNWRRHRTWQEHHGNRAASGRTYCRGARETSGHRQGKARPLGQRTPDSFKPTPHADVSGEVIYLSADALPDDRMRTGAQASDVYVRARQA